MQVCIWQDISRKGKGALDTHCNVWMQSTGLFLLSVGSFEQAGEITRRSLLSCSLVSNNIHVYICWGKHFSSWLPESAEKDQLASSWKLLWNKLGTTLGLLRTTGGDPLRDYLGTIWRNILGNRPSVVRFLKWGSECKLEISSIIRVCSFCFHVSKIFHLTNFAVL